MPITMIHAYILGRIIPSSDRAVLKELEQIENIKEVNHCYGNCDFIAKVSVQDMETLGETVCDKIRKIKGIEKTRTYICRELKSE